MQSKNHDYDRQKIAWLKLAKSHHYRRSGGQHDTKIWDQA